MASTLYSHVILGGSRLREVDFVLYDKAMLDVFVEELDGVMLCDARDANTANDAAEGVARSAALDETITLDAALATSAKEA